MDKLTQWWQLEEDKKKGAQATRLRRTLLGDEVGPKEEDSDVHSASAWL